MSEPKYKIGETITRDELIDIFAQEMCLLQKSANRWFYKENNYVQSNYLLESAGELKNFASKMGICDEMYEKAYTIYDFRRSGASDITSEEIEYLLNGGNVEYGK